MRIRPKRALKIVPMIGIIARKPTMTEIDRA